MRILGLDIETIPQRRFLTPEDPDGQKIVETTKVLPALHPTTCHVVAVNFGWLDGVGAIQTDVLMWDPIGTVDRPPGGPEEMERVLLTGAFQRLAGAVEKQTTLVTFNGKEFDLPVLRMRVALLRLPAPRLPWRKLLYPYDHREHCDLRLVLGNDKRATNGTQQMWAEAFGVHSEERGGQVWQMVREGRWGDLAGYGHGEGRTLVELYQALEPVL